MELKGSLGELRATITVKRAATGKEEIYELTGGCTQEEAEALGAKVISPRVHGASGAMVGQGSEMSNQPKEN